MKLVFVICAVLFLEGTRCCGGIWNNYVLELERNVQDFYWKNYDGTIPADAIPAGNRTGIGHTYIGQAYIHNFGVLLGTIIPGQKEVSVPCYGVKKTNIIIQILCSPEKDNYYWMPTSHTNYRTDVTDRCPVLGGYDQKAKDNLGVPLGILHVGRVNRDGNTIIGNIAYYNPHDPWFYYPVGNDEKRADNWDVLMYMDYPIIPYF